MAKFSDFYVLENVFLTANLLLIPNHSQISTKTIFLIILNYHTATIAHRNNNNNNPNYGLAFAVILKKELQTKTEIVEGYPAAFSRY